MVVIYHWLEGVEVDIFIDWTQYIHVCKVIYKYTCIGAYTLAAVQKKDILTWFYKWVVGQGLGTDGAKLQLRNSILD